MTKPRRVAREPRGGARALEQVPVRFAGTVAEAGPGVRHNAPYACEPDRRGLALRNRALCCLALAPLPLVATDSEGEWSRTACLTSVAYKLIAPLCSRFSDTRRRTGRQPFTEWLRSIPDKTTQARSARFVCARLEAGLFGDCEPAVRRARASGAIRRGLPGLLGTPRALNRDSPDRRHQEDAIR